MSIISYKLMEINEVEKSLDEFQKLSFDFPQDIRVWLGLLNLVIFHGICLPSNHDNQNKYYTNDITQLCISFKRLCQICQKLSDIFNKDDYVDLFYDNLRYGVFFFRAQYDSNGYFSFNSVKPMYDIFSSERINKLQELSDSYRKALNCLGNYYINTNYTNSEITINQCEFFLVKTLIYRGPYDTYGCIPTIKPANQQLLDDIENIEKKNRRNNNRCQHCGGRFKGLFPKCKRCGKPKDY